MRRIRERKQQQQGAAAAAGGGSEAAAAAAGGEEVQQQQQQQGGPVDLRALHAERISRAAGAAGGGSAHQQPAAGALEGRMEEEDEDMCPVCREPLANEFAMAPCGHSLCVRRGAMAIPWQSREETAAPLNRPGVHCVRGRGGAASGRGRGRYSHDASCGASPDSQTRS